VAFKYDRNITSIIDMSSLREGLTVYDACYVALARRIESKVVTGDNETLGKFPALTIPMEGYRPNAARED
jgi:predicted nucleic acid-binding protein